MMCAWRDFYSPTGQKLDMTEIDEDNLTHVDTSGLMLHRSVFDLNTMWSNMPKILSPWCDRVFLSGIKHKCLMLCFTRHRSVAFTTLYRYHYRKLGMPEPEGAKTPPIPEMMAYLTSVDGVHETVRQLGFWPLAV